MSRFAATLKNDVTVQVRNQLYSIGIGIGALVGVLVGWIGTAEQLPAIVPTLMLLAVGGSTLLYVSGMIIFERDEGTLRALTVSPLRPDEYLWSKIVSLCGLATLESITMIGVAMLVLRWSGPVEIPNIPLLLLGIVLIGIFYTLVGIILIVRYESITDFLVPMAAIASILQLPFLYFIGWVSSWILLIIPSSGPTVLMQAGYRTLATWEWIYGLGYSSIVIVGLIFWARRSFQKYVIERP